MLKVRDLELPALTIHGYIHVPVDEAIAHGMVPVGNELTDTFLSTLLSVVGCREQNGVLYAPRELVEKIEQERPFGLLELVEDEIGGE